MSKLLTTVMLMIVMLLVSISARAMIGVHPALLDIKSGTNPYSDIHISNSSSHDVYIKIEVSRLKNPEADRPIKLKDPHHPLKVGLVASPKKLIIPPHESKNVRVLLVTANSGDHDVVYQVDVLPVENPIHSHADNKQPKKIDTELQIIYAFGVKVFARPANPHAKLQIQRKGRTLTVKNVGNSNAIVYNFKQCTSKGCKKIQRDAKRIYAGESWRVTLPQDAPVTFKKSFMGKVTDVSTSELKS